MDISNDAIRRELREIEAQHRLELAPTAETMDRLMQEEASTQSKWDVITGGANRSKWMKVGGVAVLTSAVLAACGKSDDTAAATSTTQAGAAATTATTAAKSTVDAGDLMVFKFAASIENLAVAAYSMGAPLIKNKTLLDVALLFQAQHKEHAGLFNSQLTANGQKAVTEPNAVVLASLKGAIDGLKTESDVLKFAQDLEVQAAATYLSTVGLLKGPKLAYTAMTIGGTEWRHAALLSQVTMVPLSSTKDGFLNASRAIAPVGV